MTDSEIEKVAAVLNRYVSEQSLRALLFCEIADSGVMSSSQRNFFHCMRKWRD